jgi:hypothetical protein
LSGAGTEIPTIRHFGDSVGGALIRINPMRRRALWADFDC